jgi:RNase P subunit RPR2
MGAHWYEVHCGDCRKELPHKGNRRRRVPRKGGKLQIVCDECAKAIDAQQTLDADAAVPRVGLHRPPAQARRIA